MEHRLITGGEQWLPFAQSCVRKLKRLGLPYADQSYEIDGASVKVRIEPGHEYIRIDGGCTWGTEYGAIKIEHHISGDLINEAPCRIWLDGLPSSGRWKEFGVNTLNPPKDTDPYRSSVYALKDPPTKLPVQPPANASDYIDELSGEVDKKLMMRYEYPDHAGLWDKKAALLYLNPSLATGKMRTFLQTVTGALVKRVTLEFGKNLKVTSAMLDGVLEIHVQQHLIRDDHGNYWLLSWGSGRAFRLNFKPCGQKALEELKRGGHSREREVELEVLLFALLDTIPQASRKEMNKLKADPSYEPTVGWEPCVWPDAQGAMPFAYNWHFKYMANEAVRVTTTFLEYDPDLIETRLTVATIHTSAIPEGEEPVPPTISTAFAEIAQLSMYPGHNIWFVNASTQTQYTLVNPVPTWKNIPCDAPVYAFYDVSDSMTIVRFKRQAADTSIRVVPVSSLDIYGRGRALSATLRNSFTAGFYVAGGLADGTSYVGTTEQDVSRSGVERGLVGDASPAFTYYSPPNLKFPQPVATAPGVIWEAGGNIYVSSEGWQIQDCYSINISEQGFTEYHSALVFPLNNPDAVYIGGSYLKDYTGTERQIVNERTSLGYSVNDHIGYIGWSEFGTGTHYGEILTVTRRDRAFDVTLITQHQVLPVEVQGYASKLTNGFEETSGSVTVWSQVLWPDPLELWFDDIHFRAGSSAQGRVLYNTEKDTYLNNGGEFPTDDYLIQFIGDA